MDALGTKMTNLNNVKRQYGLQILNYLLLGLYKIIQSWKSRTLYEI